MMTETVVNVEQAAPNNNAAPNKPQGGNDQPLDWIKINVDYFKTTPGLLKIAEFILGIFCMSLGSPAWTGGSHFFLAIVTIAFILVILWIFVYLLGIREALPVPIDWILTELVNTGMVTIFYFIAFIIQLIYSTTSDYRNPRRGAQITAGVFGIFNTLVYAFASYLLQMEWKNRRTNQ